VKFKSILFDLDGTLVDSESVHFDAWNVVLSAFSIQLDYNQYLREYAGVSLPTNAERLVRLYDLNSTVESLVEQRQKVLMSRMENHKPKFMPHAKETVEFFHSKNIQLGLVTSSSRSEVDVVLNETGLRKYFSSVVTRDDVGRFKPDPEPYERSSKSLGHKKSDYIVFEDSFSGVRSAKAAGLTCYAIQSFEPERNKLKEQADRIFIDLSEARKYLMSNELLY
jgi:beta-phosphoglucomutase